MKYATNFEINNKMVTLLSTIMEEVGRLDDPHTMTALSYGKEKQTLPDPYDYEAYVSSFHVSRKIGPNTKRMFPWLKRQEKKLHPLFAASVYCYSLIAMTPLKEKEYEKAFLYMKGYLAEYRPIFSCIAIQPDEKIEKALAQSLEKGDIGPFILYCLKLIQDAMALSLEQTTGFEGRKTPCIRKLLDVMRAGSEYSSKAIMEKLGLKSRVAVKRNYLEPALKGGYIEMLLPNKPHSPNQRYRKKK